MLNQKKAEIFLTKIHKSLAKQFLEIAFTSFWATRGSAKASQTTRLQAAAARLVVSLTSCLAVWRS